MDEPNISEELRGMAAEPLLPVEKRLILWSLVLGVGLIGILYYVSYTFFAA
jgi:hypothetical protein